MQVNCYSLFMLYCTLDTHFYHAQSCTNTSFMLSLISMAKITTTAKPKTASKRKAVKAPSKNKVPKPEAGNLPPVEDRKCSFCGRSYENVKNLISGPPPLNAFICDECISVCVKILAETNPQDWHYWLTGILAAIKQKNEIPLDKGKTKTKGKKTTPRWKPDPQMVNN